MTAPSATRVALAAILSGLASGVHGAEPGRCALRLIADPPELVLGEGARATLRVETDGAVPRLTTSVGRLEALRQMAPGLFAVDLVPPEEAAPQLAIVAASTGGGCGWTAVRLVGQGTVVVRSTPGARIVVRIADRMFGPALADADGFAHLPVVVPPGVHVAYHGQRAIPLAVPPVRRVHVVLDATSARADVDTGVPVRVFATTEDGAPWAGARVAVTTSTGEAPRLAEVAPGELVGRWQLPAGLARDETLAAGVEGSRPEAESRLSRSPGPVASIEVLPEPQAAPGDVEEVQVNVRTRDAAGNPVDADVVPRIDLGAASPATRVAPGAARFSIRLPTDAGGRDRVEVAAAAGGVAGFSAILLVPGVPARIAGSLNAPPLRADGRSTGQLHFGVLDARGVPVPAPAPVVEAANVVATLEPERPGFYVLSYHAPRRADDTTAMLRVAAAGAASSSEVRLVGARPRLEVSPELGVAIVSGHTWLEPSLEVAAWTRRFGPDLGLALEVGWTGRSERSPAAAGAPAHYAQARYVWLLAQGGWRWATSRRTLLWATAGAGAAHASSSMRVEGQPSVTESAWVPCADASVAWGVRAWHGFPFVELGARWQGDPHLTGLRGTLFPITALAGYRFEVL